MMWEDLKFIVGRGDWAVALFVAALGMGALGWLRGFAWFSLWLAIVACMAWSLVCILLASSLEREISAESLFSGLAAFLGAVLGGLMSDVSVALSGWRVPLYALVAAALLASARPKKPKPATGRELVLLIGPNQHHRDEIMWLLNEHKIEFLIRRGEGDEPVLEVPGAGRYTGLRDIRAYLMRRMFLG